MKLHQTQTEFNCGIDLHARNMYICVMDRQGKVLVHRNIRHNDFGFFLDLVEPYLHDLTVACECTFNWYWPCDACHDFGIRFVLGHALYMKAIHGTKTKNDKVDSEKIAHLLRSNMLPEAYCCSAERRPLRALLRRRMRLVHLRSGLAHHIGGTVQSHGLPPITRQDIRAAQKHRHVPDRFDDPFLALGMDIAVDLMHHIDRLILRIETEVFRHSRLTESGGYSLLKSIPGVGNVLALTILYEIDDIGRFPTVRDFCSYCRLSPPDAESAGKVVGVQGAKMGNQYLKWAFTQAAVIAKRGDGPIQRMTARIQSRKGKRQANAILAHRLAKAAYHMLRSGRVFDLELFVKGKVKIRKQSTGGRRACRKPNCEQQQVQHNGPDESVVGTDRIPRPWADAASHGA
jgi:transposase